MPDPQTAKASVDGKKLSIDDLPEYKEFTKKTPTQEEVKQDEWLYSSEDIRDFSTLHDVNTAINQVKLKKAVVNRKLKVARKNAASAKYFYERAKRRQIVTVSGSSDRVRSALAEIYTEELETQAIVTAVEEEELKSLLRSLVKEGEDLRELSYNIRKEMDLL